MHAGEATGTKLGLWLAELGQVSAPSHVRGLSRARLEVEHANSAGVAIASSLFLLLLAAALLIGGHVTIDPLLRSAIAAREARGLGDVVYTTPDGIFCRHMSFDTTTEIADGAMERCLSGLREPRL